MGKVRDEQDQDVTLRCVIRTEFPTGQIGHVEAAADALGLPVEEFVRRAVIEAVNMVYDSSTFASSWGSLRPRLVHYGRV